MSLPSLQQVMPRHKCCVPGCGSEKFLFTLPTLKPGFNDAEKAKHQTLLEEYYRRLSHVEGIRSRDPKNVKICHRHFESHLLDPGCGPDSAPNRRRDALPSLFLFDNATKHWEGARVAESSLLRLHEPELPIRSVPVHRPPDLPSALPGNSSEAEKRTSCLSAGTFSPSLSSLPLRRKASSPKPSLVEEPRSKILAVASTGESSSEPTARTAWDEEVGDVFNVSSRTRERSPGSDVSSGPDLDFGADSEATERLLDQLLTEEAQVCDGIDVLLAHDHTYGKDGETPKRYKDLIEQLTRMKKLKESLRVKAWRVKKKLLKVEDCLKMVREEAEDAPYRLIEGCFGTTFSMLLKRKKENFKGTCASNSLCRMTYNFPAN